MADLLRYEDARYLRQATQEEINRSIRAATIDGGVGAIDVEGVTCYVSGETEQEAFLALADAIARGHQDVDLEDFARRVAQAIDGGPVGFDVDNWDWDDVQNAVAYGLVSVDDLRSMIRSGLA